MRRALPLLLVLALAAGCSGSGGDRADPTPSSDRASGPSAPGSPTGASVTPGASSPARPTRPPVAGAPKLVQIGKFESPVFVTAAPGDPRVLVLEKAGRIRVFSRNEVRDEPFLDIRDDVSDNSERGLLSLAFPPDHQTSRRVYVTYTANDGDVTLARYVMDQRREYAVDPDSREILLAVPHPRGNHNGGTIAFDRAGMLLWSIGDGGGGNDPDDNAQDLGSLLGKILRLDVGRSENGKPYAIPSDNPFRDTPGARPEVYAYGLRNPWRFTLDDDGTMYLGDVGQSAAEEIDVVAPDRLAGANFGWPAYEGRRRTAKPNINGAGVLIEPTLVYPHDGRCAVTGGPVYRGRLTALRGRYLFADFCAGQVLSVPPGVRDAKPQEVAGLHTDQLASFGMDGYGDVYIVSLAGPVFAISA